MAATLSRWTGGAKRPCGLGALLASSASIHPGSGGVVSGVVPAGQLLMHPHTRFQVMPSQVYSKYPYDAAVADPPPIWL